MKQILEINCNNKQQIFVTCTWSMTYNINRYQNFISVYTNGLIGWLILQITHNNNINFSWYKKKPLICFSFAINLSECRTTRGGLGTWWPLLNLGARAWGTMFRLTMFRLPLGGSWTPTGSEALGEGGSLSGLSSCIGRARAREK